MLLLEYVTSHQRVNIDGHPAEVNESYDFIDRLMMLSGEVTRHGKTKIFGLSDLEY